ncbi:hypothetical protein, partial [Salmonella sp. s51944]|uniref:hypothetical protein n=1 Tax=Salmonella sp. s51944 TaxID=3159655 RepID=UPI00398141FF
EDSDEDSNEMSDDHDRKSSSEEGHRHGGGRRHHGSRSHSGESRHRRGILRIRDYMNNIRNFDGNKVVDMHVVNTQKLGDLSAAATEQLQKFLKPSQ